MSPETAIRVESVSKGYRIGASAGQHDTLAGALAGALTHPLEQFRRLRALRTVRPGDPADNIVWALRDLSFSVPSGQVLGIVGHNGAGKSTLLKVLARITEPTAGRIELRGRISSLLEVGTGFHPELTGRENIYLNATLLGMRKAEVDARLDAIVAFSGVERFLDTPLKRYSSGMKVRLAFSVAAHLEPEILIIDEVLAVGDINFQQKCIRRMQEIATSGRTVLLVSHQTAHVRQLATAVLTMHQGAGEYFEDPEAGIRKHLALQKALAGDTAADGLSYDAQRPINVLDAQIVEQQASTLTCGLTVELRASAPDWAITLPIFAQQQRVASIDTRRLLASPLPTEPGTHRIHLRIDTTHLAAGDYTFTLAGFHGLQELFRYEEVLAFSLAEAPPFTYRGSTGRGFFAPQFEVTLER